LLRSARDDEFDRQDKFLNSLLARIADSCGRHAMITFVAGLILAAMSLFYAGQHLKMDTDTGHLFKASLPWRQADLARSRNFPQFDNIILGVVRGATPEEAQETAKALAAAANADQQLFHNAVAEGSDNFFAQDGLLLLPTPQLEKLLTRIIAAQPFLGQLAADPSLRGLFTAIGLIAQGAQLGQADLKGFGQPLNAISDTLNNAAAGHPTPLSWISLLDNGLADSTVFVVAHPILNHGDLQQGAAATTMLNTIAARLPDVKNGRATLGVTGEVPLDDQQFASLTRGLGVSITVMLLLITLWLYLALRSARMIFAVLFTLCMGLIFTLFFAAVAVGTLNMISVAFAILFVGLAVDFAIQFAVRFRDVARAQGGADGALYPAAYQVGGQIALAALATSCGFFAFAPTSFLGVAELGMIAGGGMIIAFFCTITILPAALVLFGVRAGGAEVALPGGNAADGALQRARRPILLVLGVLALAGAGAAATTRFDANPLDTQDPTTPAMRTLQSLLANPVANPFYADALADNVGDARALAKRFAALPGAGTVISGATFIPDEQEVKLEMIAQTQRILAPTLFAVADAPRPGVRDFRIALNAALTEIDSARPKLAPDSALLRIAAAMQKLQAAPDAVVNSANLAVTRFLPAQLTALNTSLNPDKITMENLPAGVKDDWFTRQGQVLVKVTPRNFALNSAAMARFVHAVQEIDPRAGGPAITAIASADTVLAAFRTASLLAVVAILAILLAVFRSLRDAALVLSALALSALLTALFVKLCGVELNFANIIALPLLLGVGVSFNVYFVMNWRAGMRSFLGSSTARAILFSALTTGTAFGSLAASDDRGMSSLGLMLLLSLAAVLVSTFIYLPALLFGMRQK
jgi:hopanoid biosynthesis associated RND transporter like protein HpnN